MPQPFEEHLRSSADLRTSYAAVRAGFVALALEKNRRATPHIDEARQLKASAARATRPADLLNMVEIRPGMLGAAGVSDKAGRHLQESDKNDAIVGLIGNFLEPAGSNFVEELVFRFLLTRGDTLGGSMRNIGGFMAQRKLTRSLISCLRLSGRGYWWQHKDTKGWAVAPNDDVDIELSIRGLAWMHGSKPRTLVSNLTVPLVKNNVDLCLLDSDYRRLDENVYARPSAYIALGELKGGIDPAGADEHWKTARTALGRIHSAFEEHDPATFFIGAAIEAKMADEIWTLLQNGTIHNAANLTDDNQIASITRWLCNL